ncbi:MAG: EamA family transporter RarD [Bifidobacteriaceae bacterium]|nr:EamA family transporter RarD [Bifidobacteriaceae bacterium]
MKSRAGLILAVGAYAWWGGLPLYLSRLTPTGAVEVIAHRIVWSLVVCLGVVVATHRWRELRNVLSSLRLVGTLAISGALLTANWLVFVYSIESGQLVDGALGYFINPLVTVALAVMFMHERLRVAQWVAIGVAASAVIVISVAYGRFPWIAVALSLTWGLYGYIEKRVGRGVSAVTALSVETLLMAPLALGLMGLFASAGRQTFVGLGAAHTWLMVGVGGVTVVPLLLFNGAARRLPLSILGLTQYLCPVMQFLVAVAVLHEPMAPARWAGFAIVWVALAILSWDGLRAARANPRPAPIAPTPRPRRSAGRQR